MNQPAATATVNPPQIVLPAPKILLMGDPGGGKTYSAGLLARHVKKLCVLFTEQGSETYYDEKFPADLRAKIGKDIHFMQIAPGDTAMKTILDNALTISRLSYSALTELPAQNRDKVLEFLEIVKGMMDFKCMVSGQNLGPVELFPNDWAFVFDGFSGMNTAARHLTIGTKPTLHQGEWGVAMQIEEELIDKMCNGLKCWVVCVSHMDREPDEVTGGVKVYPGLLGKKLGPKVPRKFSEVIECKRMDTKWVWSNKSQNISTKFRALPLSDSITPDWKPIVDNFQRALTAQAAAAKAAIPLPEAK